MPRLLLLSLLASLLLPGCDTQDLQRDFELSASLLPEGITRTSDDGDLLEQDPDDWRTAPLFAGKVTIDPPFPNPAQGGLVSLQVLVHLDGAVRGGLRLQARRTDGRLISLDYLPEASAPGFHAFQFSSGLLGQKGLHRLFIFDGSGALISYGDLLLE